MRKVKPNEFEKIANNIYKKNNKYNGNELRYILNYLDYENGGKSKGSWVIELERKFAKKFNL